jgi:glycosyltransferase involved in cell wall biosynthesis
MSRRIWLDVTTLKHWQRPAVGVVRVESEVCRLFLEKGDHTLGFCTYDKHTFRFDEVSIETVHDWVRRIQDFRGDGNAPAPEPRQDLRVSRPRRIVRRHLVPMVANLPDGLRRPLVRHLSGQLAVAERLWGRLKGVRETPPPAAVEAASLQFGHGDVYVSLGLDWDYKNMHHLYMLKRERDVRHVLICYDLIPYLFPHLCVGDVAAIFAKYFADLCWSASHVMCISQHSQKDLLALCRELSIPLPNTSVIPLGSDLATPREENIGAAVRRIADREFILFVSTIERRKNHEALYRAVVRILESGRTPPHVVFVGMIGWGVGELISDLTLDPRVKDRFTMLDRVNDDELALLYRRCLFTVYPSLYEGWGLPVAESLRAGKFCIASSTSSVPEVGGDLIDYCDPWNASEWAEKIVRYNSDRGLLSEREMEVANRYEPTNWRQSAQQVLNIARGLLSDAGADLGRAYAAPAEM